MYLWVSKTQYFYLFKASYKVSQMFCFTTNFNQDKTIEKPCMRHHMRHRMRLRKCFVLQHMTKHMRSLVRGFEWIEILDLTTCTQPKCFQYEFSIGKKNNTRTVQAESSKFASLLFDHGFQLVIHPRNKKNYAKSAI